MKTSSLFFILRIIWKCFIILQSKTFQDALYMRYSDVGWLGSLNSWRKKYTVCKILQKNLFIKKMFWILNSVWGGTFVFLGYCLFCAMHCLINRFLSKPAFRNWRRCKRKKKLSCTSPTWFLKNYNFTKLLDEQNKNIKRPCCYKNLF